METETDMFLFRTVLETYEFTGEKIIKKLMNYMMVQLIEHKLLMDNITSYRLILPY